MIDFQTGIAFGLVLFFPLLPLLMGIISFVTVSSQGVKAYVSGFEWILVTAIIYAAELSIFGEELAYLVAICLAAFLLALLHCLGYHKLPAPTVTPH